MKSELLDRSVNLTLGEGISGKQSAGMLVEEWGIGWELE